MSGGHNYFFFLAGAFFAAFFAPAVFEAAFLVAFFIESILPNVNLQSKQIAA